MLLGINAYNIRSGGGVTHLVELLRAIELPIHGFHRVLVWGNKDTLEKIDNKEWLTKIHDPLLDRGLFFRIYWQLLKGRSIAIKAGCDILFVPGGSYSGNYFPTVTLSQNMLPFEWGEMARYGLSFLTIKFLLLRWTQGKSFKKSAGVIFLTDYAKNKIEAVIGSIKGRTSIIPHGINPIFRLPPRPQEEFLGEKTKACNILYVSSVEPYKHQWHVVRGVKKLLNCGLEIRLDLVGPAASGLPLLSQTINEVDPNAHFAKYHGEMPYDKLSEVYKNADIAIFASSCENMPNILIESMASGLPIACSDRGPMKEVLGEGGVYFDPESPDDIADALYRLISSTELRAKKAKLAFNSSKKFSWSRCADETFKFLAVVASDKSFQRTNDLIPKTQH